MTKPLLLAARIMFFILAAFALLLSVYKPYDNWDIIGYVASAKSFELGDAGQLNAFTYSQLKSRLSADHYEFIAEENSNGFGHAIRTDTVAFKEQLPFYKIRPVYNGLIYLFYKTGFNIITSIYLISGLSVAAAIFFLYLIAIRFLPEKLVFTIPPLAVAVGILDLARYSTPDALMFFAVIATAYLYLTKKLNILFILLPLIIGIRTDFILFSVLMVIAMYYANKCDALKCVLSICVSILIYFSIGIFYSNPGWSTIFYFTLVNIIPRPISTPHELTPVMYVTALFKGVISMLINKAFNIYALAAAIWLYKMRDIKHASQLFKEQFNVLAIISFVFIVLHFILFPATYDRYFISAYMLGVLSLLRSFKKEKEDIPVSAGQK